MDLHAYFEQTKGTGVLATADREGKVNAAIFARPHILDDGRLAFIMTDRLTHYNLTQNPCATFLFHEDGPGYQGKRLYLRKIHEEQDSELLHSLRRRTAPKRELPHPKPLFLVVFELEKELPLIGPTPD